MSNKRRQKGRILGPLKGGLPQLPISVVRLGWSRLERRKKRRYTQCAVCGYSHRANLRWTDIWRGSPIYKAHALAELEKTRPKQHPRKEKRGQGKPR